MKLNHINLLVTDVSKAVAFFETYFGFKCVELKGENIIAILEGTDGFTLVLMKDKETVDYPKAFHIGFLLDTEMEVNEVNSKLKAGGFSVVEPRKIRDSYGFYFHFDGIMIEVGYYP